MKNRPSLAEATAKSVQLDVEARGVVGFVPYWLMLSIIVGAVVAVILPGSFFLDARWDVSTAVYAGILAFNGLLMSLGWFSFSKIQEILLNDDVGKMLTRHDLLGIHLAFIDLTHLILIAACFLSGAGLVAIPMALPLVADQLLLASTIGMTIYALYRAYSATSVANSLIWEQAHLNIERPPLRTVEGGHDKSQESP